MLSDQMIEMILKGLDPIPAEFNRVWMIDWDGGNFFFHEDTRFIAHDELQARAKSHFGRMAHTFKDETLVAYWILSTIFPPTIAERYMVAFRDFLFQRGWVEMNLQFGPRWVIGWMHGAAYSREVQPFLLWHAREREQNG